MEDIDWDEFGPEYCKPLKIPKHTKFDTIGYNWIAYDDIWCAGCYNSYIEICRRVYKEFKLNKTKDYHFIEKDLIEKVVKLVEKTKKEPSEKWLSKHQSKIESLIECINMRVYQHINCYKNKIETNRYNVSNKGHMRNLFTLCSSLLKLFILYEYKLKQYNDTHPQNPKENILLDLNEECANFCFGSLQTNDIEYMLESLGLTKEDIPKTQSNNFNITNHKANELLKKRDLISSFKARSPPNNKLSRLKKQDLKETEKKKKDKRYSKK